MPVGRLFVGVRQGDDLRQEILARGREAVEFARFSLHLFDDLVLGNPAYVDMIRSEAFTHRTYDMGTVDEKGRVVQSEAVPLP